MTRIDLRHHLLASVLFISIVHGYFSAETCMSEYYPSTTCVDKLDHYECVCRQGQLWIGHSCVADAVDSRLVFNISHFPSYVKLNSKTFPRITELTIAFWLRIWPKYQSAEHTILYYKTGQTLFSSISDDTSPALLVTLTETNHLHVELLNSVYDVPTPLPFDQWHHVIIAHHLSRHDGIRIMLNGSHVVVIISTKIRRNTKEKLSQTIDSGGAFFVGQAMNPTNVSSSNTAVDFEFNIQRAFHGELAFLNMWQRMLTDSELYYLAYDCHAQLQQCGDAIDWMDFVIDIKGETQIDWPSGIHSLFDNCPTQQWLNEACSTYCRKREGPHCKNESELSMIWQKTNAGKTLVEHCPGRVKNGSVYRTCEQIEQIARWTSVNYGECAHPLVISIDQELETSLSDRRNKEEIIELRDKCAFLAETIAVNLTETQLYSSIDLILLIEQIERLTNALTSHFDSLTQWYSSSFEPFYVADINATFQIHQYLIEAISKLIDDRHASVWNQTRPLGNDFVRLLTTLQRVTSIVAQVLIQNCTQFPGCLHRISTENINQTIRILTRQELNLFIYENEPTQTRVSFANGKKNLNRTIGIFDERNNNGSVWYAVSITSLKTAHTFIPNLKLGRISKFDNINSYIISVDIKLRKPIQRSQRLSTLIPIDNIPILFTMGYLIYDNTSDNRCVMLVTTNAFMSVPYKSPLLRQWQWQSSPSVCNWTHTGASDRGTCSCFVSNGTFAITSDLFDPNWRPPESRLRPLGVFSYIGSIILVSLAIFTMFMLNYLRTRSATAYIHKHYALAVCLAQAAMVLAFNGIPHHHQFLCRAVACTAHYFILSSYCWLMNEAFNLYIQITYTTHLAVSGANTALSDAASKYRFLGMGYVLPFCIVTLVASIKKSAYFMPAKMRLCFIDLEDWFKVYFIPITAIIFITIMVMIFSAKQQHESSYTKNDKANEAIVTYTSGIWSQLFLLTISWAFAMMSFYYLEAIITFMHGFFTCLQGIFLFLSFFVFNDEVRRHYRERRRQLRRIQLLEIPYRGSVTDSEDRRSSVGTPAMSPQLPVATLVTSTPTSPTKVNAMATAVSQLLMFKQQKRSSTPRHVYDEMKWTLRKRSSNEAPQSENVLSNDKAVGDNDDRVTVV